MVVNIDLLSNKLQQQHKVTIHCARHIHIAICHPIHHANNRIQL